MTTTGTYEIRLSARYALDHLEASTIPGTFVDRNGRGILIRFSLGELHELWSRVDYHADPTFARELADAGMSDLHRSAKTALGQIKRAGLLEVAKSHEAAEAYSIEWRAAMGLPATTA